MESNQYLQLELFPSLKRESLNLTSGARKTKRQKKKSTSLHSRPKNLSLEIKKENLHQSINQYSFDNFLVGPSNKLAFDYLCSLQSQKDDGEYTQSSPTFLLAGPGLGKTHLLRSLNKAIERSRYYYGMEIALKIKTQEDLLYFVSNLPDILIIDDFDQMFMEKNATLEAHFNFLLEILMQKNHKLVLSSCLPFEKLPLTNIQLSSRLRQCLVQSIQEFCPSVKKGVVKNFQKKMNKEFHLNGENSPKEAHKLLGQMANYKPKKNRPKEVASKNVSGSEVEKLIQKVADENLLSVKDLLSQCRKKNAVMARHQCMYQLRNNIKLSFKEIGAIFKKDHSSVMYAVSKFS
jgi:chromosomal replication initiator protein